MISTKMKICGITISGLEDNASLEVKELLGISAKTHDSIITFDTNDDNLIAKYCFLSRASSRIIALISEDTIKDDHFLPSIPKEIPFIDKAKTFRVNCKRIGEHSFSSNDIERNLGEKIIKETGLKVDLHNPDVIFYSFIKNDSSYLGVDLCGFDLSKRDYKIVNNPFSIKGNIAFLMLKIAKYKTDSVLLDPFIKSGEVVIEAASYASKQSIHHYQSEDFMIGKYLGIDMLDFEENTKVKTNINAYAYNQKYIEATKKNAKIQGQNKLIEFSRIEVDWLDTKFKEESVDHIVTIYLKLHDKTEMEKEIKELFHQADYILKKNGCIVIFTNIPKMFNSDKYKTDIISIDNNRHIVKLVKK